MPDDLNLIERMILRREVMNYVKSLLTHWTSFAAVAAAVMPFMLPSLLAYISAHPHTTWGVLLGAVIAAYNATAPKDKPNLPTVNQSVMKVIALGLLFLGLAHPSVAQTPAPLTNIYAAGISFNHSGSPGIAGTGLYARLISDGSGTYVFTVVDALPTTLKPFTVTSNFGAGVAQKVFAIGKIPIFVPTSAGISYNGTNTGWAWSTGTLASIRIKNNWRVFPNVRIVKSSVSNGTGYQPIVGLLFGWGQ
jgi:hypothetical protein